VAEISRFKASASAIGGHAIANCNIKDNNITANAIYTKKKNNTLKNRREKSGTTLNKHIT
jgi:hypothetical protein